MKLEIKLVGEQEPFVITINDGRTLNDIYEVLADLQSSPFILLGDHILQKATIERIKRN